MGVDLDSIPAEAWEAAMRIALERMSLWGSAWTHKRRQRAEAQRVMKEAEAWPLSRCVTVLPYVGSVEHHTSGVFKDGHLKFCMVVIWLAPFPAHYVSLDFRCEILVGGNPDPAGGCRRVTYTARAHKVVDSRSDGEIEFLDAGSARWVEIAIAPDEPILPEELGTIVPARYQTRLGRTVDIKALQITAHAPWRKVRDTEYLPDLSFWVPQWGAE